MDTGLHTQTAFQQPARLDLRYPELECAGAQAPLVSDEIINVILPALPPTDSEQVRRDRSRTQLHVISRATPDIPGIRQQIMDLKRALSIKAQLRQGQIDPAGLGISRVQINH